MKWNDEPDLNDPTIIPLERLQMSGDKLNPDLDRERRAWELRKDKLLIYSGLIGIFLYTFIVEILGMKFYLEFLLGFLALTGVGLAGRLDKK